MPRFSVIIPVYNRPDEIYELLRSLEKQNLKNFEVIIIEDGSTVRCDEIVARFADILTIKYEYKENEGRSIARNRGMAISNGDYFIFFDSDCVIPPTYFAQLTSNLDKSHSDCFGGPDDAHDSFSDKQKAINIAMTSFLTTGGIRGGKMQLEKFTPRTFNMGFSREVWENVGGFREMFSEDIDMSKRIALAGFKISLFRDTPVWHKRRVNFKKFFRQVYIFGMSRITLQLLYPGSLKPVHALPALFVLFLITSLVLSIVTGWWLQWLLFGLYFLAIFASGAFRSRSLKIATLAVPAAFIQLTGYGIGFIKAFCEKFVLRRRRDINKEILIRKGK